MNDALHPLLRRQMRKHLRELDHGDPALRAFLMAVSESYTHFEDDRQLLDRAMEISSRELLESNGDLRHKNEMLDAFVYRVSHDLKAPIHNVIALVNMIRETQAAHVAADPLFRRILENLQQTSERMNERIADLLEISRMERCLDAKEEVVALEPVLRKVMDDLAVEIQKSGATVSHDFAAAPCMCGSHENIYSLLSNLVSNAIKYRHSERSPYVRVESLRDGPYDLLRIADNGIGIDLERHGKQLFGMFNRFHTHVDGTGVGLFIIKRIIEKAGGKIEVRSKVDEGTTFDVYLVHKARVLDRSMPVTA